MRTPRHIRSDQEHYLGMLIASDGTPWYLYTQWVDHRSRNPDKGGWKAFAYGDDGNFGTSPHARYESHVCYTTYLALEEVQDAIENDVKEETR